MLLKTGGGALFYFIYYAYIFCFDHTQMQSQLCKLACFIVTYDPKPSAQE